MIVIANREHFSDFARIGVNYQAYSFNNLSLVLVELRGLFSVILSNVSPMMAINILSIVICTKKVARKKKSRISSVSNESKAEEFSVRLPNSPSESRY